LEPDNLDKSEQNNNSRKDASIPWKKSIRYQLTIFMIIVPFILAVGMMLGMFLLYTNLIVAFTLVAIIVVLVFSVLVVINLVMIQRRVVMPVRVLMEDIVTYRPDSVLSGSYSRTKTTPELNTGDEFSVLERAIMDMESYIETSMVKLSEAEELTKLMLDATPLCCQLWDRNLNTMDCNEAGVKLYGFKDKQEYIDKFLEYCSPVYQPDGQRSDEKAVKLVNKTFEEGYCVFDWMHKMPYDDSLIPAEITLVRIQYKDDYVVAGYTRDLREHDKMMKAIEQRDSMLQAVNQAAVLLLATDMGGNIVSPLIAGMELIGRSIDADRVIIWRNETVDGVPGHVCDSSWDSEIGRQIGHVPTGFSIPYGEFGLDWEQKFQDGEYISGPISVMRPNEQIFLGSYGVKSVVIIPLFIHEQFWGLFSIDDCVHERYFSEDEITILRSVSFMMASAINRQLLMKEITDAHDRTTHQLEELVKERTNELRMARDAAEIANHSKSAFLASMSHEIRTPMNAIMGMTDILMLKEQLPDDIETGLDRISISCGMLLGIINDILDFSKIEAGKMDILPAQYRVADLITDSVRLNMIRNDSKPIEFELHVEDDIPAKLIGDELRIKQILNNLLSNAFKYTNEGKISLYISAVNKPGEDMISLEFTVQDTGHGMTKEQLERLFEEYSRFNTDAGKDISGTGLGLAITERLVGIMNGGIHVDSEPGKGSKFVVRLPQGRVDDEVLGAVTAGDLRGFRMTDLTQKRKRIKRDYMPYGKVLIVDDLKANLLIAEGLLKPYGLNIETALSGQDTINKIMGGKSYDIVFMDHMMPEMDGMETTKHLRALGYKEPIVALTANAIVGQAEVFMQNGFDEFISKPIDIRQLSSILHRFIRDKYTPDEASDKMKGKGVAGLDIPKGLERYNNDEMMYIKVLRAYSANVKSLLDGLDPDSDDDINEFKIKVHGIKGASYGIMADVIGRYAEKLEDAAESGDFDYIRKNNPAFKKAARKFVNELTDMIEEIDRENPKPGKDKPDKEVLSKLRAACMIYDMRGVDAAMSEIDAYKYDSDDGLSEWLREKADLMNFAQIAERLSEMLD